MASVKRNFLYSVVLTTANYIFPLITFPYVSRVLGVEAIGLCGFINSVVDYFVLFSTMGLNILGIREIAKVKNDREQLSKTFSSLFYLNLITTVLMLFVLFVATITISRLRENIDLMIIGGVKLTFNFLLIEWFYKGIENFKYITIRSLIVKSIYVVSILLFIHSRNDYVVYFFLSTMMIVVNSLINLQYSKKMVDISFKHANLALFVKPFFLLGVYNLLTSMYTTFNVSFLGFVSTNTQVGFYTTALKIYSLIFSIYTAFSGVMLPRMSSILSKGDMTIFKEMIVKSYSFLLFITIPIIIFSFFHASGIIRVISGDGYEGAVLPLRIIMPMMIIIGFELILIEQILMPMGKDRLILFNSILGAVVGIILNISIVPSLGSVGSATVKVCSEVVVFGCAFFEVYKLLGINLPWNKIIQYIWGYTPLIMIEVFMVLSIKDNLDSMLLSIPVSCVYFLLVNIFYLKDIDMFGFLRVRIKRHK